MKLINSTGGDRIIDELRQTLASHSINDSEIAAFLLVLGQNNRGTTP